MAQNNQEIESKYFVLDLEPIEFFLLSIGAKCIVPRKFEYNLRFDDEKQTLNREHRVLRLRKYDDFRLTYKGPGSQVDGALSRVEIEIVIDNFDSAEKILEALGYKVAAIYEKYRTMYQLDKALITLDELPYGKFVEIEAESAAVIKNIADQLHLDHSRAIPTSYQRLFEELRTKKNLSMNNLTFEDFSALKISPFDLGVLPADM